MQAGRLLLLISGALDQSALVRRTEDYIRVLVPGPRLLFEFTLFPKHHTQGSDLHERAVEGRTTRTLKRTDISVHRTAANDLSPGPD